MYTFDVTGVRKNLGDSEYERVTTAAFKDDEGHTQWHPIVNYITTMSMVCGFDEITEDNADSVWTRIVEYESVTGFASLMFPSKYKPSDLTDKITLYDVRRLVGFQSNASTMTDSQWSEKLLRMLREDVAKEKKARQSAAAAGDTLYATYDKFARNVADDTGNEIINKG